MPLRAAVPLALQAAALAVALALPAFVGANSYALFIATQLGIYIIASSIIFIYGDIGYGLKGALHTCYRRHLSSSGYAAHLNCVGTRVIRMSIG